MVTIEERAAELDFQVKYVRKRLQNRIGVQVVEKSEITDSIINAPQKCIVRYDIGRNEK